MNTRCVVCSGLVTCVLGAILGVAIAEINRHDPNPNAHSDYALVGAAMGLFIGSAQEALRQKAHEAEIQDDEALNQEYWRELRDWHNPSH